VNVVMTDPIEKQYKLSEEPPSGRGRHGQTAGRKDVPGESFHFYLKGVPYWGPLP